MYMGSSADTLGVSWTHQPSHWIVAMVDRAATTAAHALGHRKIRKIREHAHNCPGATYTFIPLVVEALGGWEEDSISCLRRIAQALGARLGVPPHVASPRLFQRLAIALWLGNAAMWSRRAEIFPLEVDGLV